MTDSANYQCMYWDVSEWKLKDLAQASGFNLPQQENERLPALSVKPGKLLGMIDLIAERPFATRAVKFIDVDLKNSKPAAQSKKSVLVLAFDSRLKQPKGIDNWSQAEFDLSLPVQTVRFPVDEKLSWFLSKEMSEFSIYLGEETDYSVLSARLNDGKTLIPSLSVSSVSSVEESNDGVFRVKMNRFPVHFRYDVSNIPDAVACYCELSRPRAMFQLDNFTYRDVRPAKKPLKTWSQAGTTGDIAMERAMFPEDACYQLRVFAKKADGSLTGMSSDQVNLGINDRPPGQEL